MSIFCMYPDFFLYYSILTMTLRGSHRLKEPIKLFVVFNELS